MYDLWVRIASQESSAFIESSPTAYEFPSMIASLKSGRDWDVNWLVIKGSASAGDGRSWSFRHPSLTTWEAATLHAWLLSVSEQQVTPTTSIDEDGSLLFFTEPNLAFSVTEYADAGASIRCHLSHEALPSWMQDENMPEIWASFASLRVSNEDLRCAAGEWAQELSAFPER